jgi:hypothetical protein
MGTRWKFIFILFSRRIWVRLVGLIGSREKRQLKTTLLGMGSQGENWLAKLSLFLAKFDDFLLKYCILKKNTKATASKK